MQTGLSVVSENPQKDRKGPKGVVVLPFGLLDPLNSLVEGGYENVKVAWGTEKIECGQKLVSRFFIWSPESLRPPVSGAL